MEKNVIVTDLNGKIIGSTYLRRARGLVKNNRAEWVDDSQAAVILTCPPDIVEEDNLMENTVNAVNTQNTNLFFNVREWSFNDRCPNNKGERCFIEDSSGELVEVYTIGTWGWEWTEIISKPYALQKNTTYRFTFWLNGGENDRNDELCQLRICFDEDEKNQSIYKLNRSFIKPKKHIDGWYLYEIPFNTGDSETVRLKFTAMRAPMAIKPAKALSEYAEIESTPVPEGKPQRHNIVFEKGWPEERAGGNNNNGTHNGGIFINGSPFDGGSFGEQIKERIIEEIDVDEIVSDIKDELQEQFGDDFAEQVKESIKNSWNNGDNRNS